jgi:SAM-dependent methyltransferase
MRRETLELLRCPSCRAGSLVPEADVAAREVVFGPVQCVGCRARLSVSEGLIDMAETLKPPHFSEALVARNFETVLRPALDLLCGAGWLDREREYVLIRGFLGSVTGPLVDIGCGPGAFVQRLCADKLGQPVIGLDSGRPMLEEAIALTRENGHHADFIRSELPSLPFLSNTLEAVMATGVLHFVPDLEQLFAEVARCLKPGGRFVFSTYDADGLLKFAPRLGHTARSEAALRVVADNAGLIRFERLEGATALMVAKVERP